MVCLNLLVTYVFRLFPTEWMFPRLALTLCQAKIVLCFLHEWRLPPSDVTDNGGKNGGDVPGLSQDEEKVQVLMQKMQSPVQRLQVWRTMDEIAQFTNRDKDYIRSPIDSQKDFNSYV